MSTSHASVPRLFPAREEHAEAWTRLAREIAAEHARRSRHPDPPPLAEVPRGRLTVLGSGIQTVGFTLGDREMIERADRVFFCVADPATIVWLKRLRPDAYDLYVLYDDAKPRYATYMQMAEAMLHGVRRGEHVVCVFYGHPGVFVLSTHRAIAIARREGHAAEMRAAVSALDCLCADLGIDPSNPGLQTHEATDLLVRRRVPDTTLHVVLWQVGLIGELGFRRKGFLNRNFSTFVEYLQGHYGAAYPVVHYIASRYPTVPPLIERSALDALHDPAVQARITGLSTFYLAPGEVRAADPEMVARLGLLRPGERVRERPRPLREIDGYGPRERRAIADFGRFRVPEEYQWQEDTAASDFLIALRSDVELQDLYAVRPDAALASPRFAALSARERALLLTRDPGAIQIAAKGTSTRPASNHRLLVALLKDRHACSSLLRAYAAAARQSARRTLETIAARYGEPIDWGGLRRDIEVLNRHHILPWTGVYRDDRRQLALTILGSAARQREGLIFVNDVQLRAFAFDRGVLEWRADRGNPHSGFLRLDVTNGTRTVVGQIWPGDTRPADNPVEAIEADPDRRGLGQRALDHLVEDDGSRIHGEYALRLLGSRRTGLVRLVFDGTRLAIDGAPVELTQAAAGHLTWTNGSGELFDGELTFVLNPITQTPECFGRVRVRAGQDIACYGSTVNACGTAVTVDAPDSVIPAWLLETLRAICTNARATGGLLLWHKWEKHALTSRAVNGVVTRLAVE